MKIKVLFLIRTLLIGLMFFTVSCKKNDVKTIELDNSFALSLFSDTLSMEQLLSMMDSTVSNWIKIEPNGDMYAYYADSVFDVVTTNDLLYDFGNITFNMESEFEVPDIPISPMPVPIDLTFDDLLILPFVFDGYSINSVIMRSGRLSFNLTTNLSIIETIELSTDDIILSDGTNLIVSLDVKNNDTNVDIDLTQCRILPQDHEIRFSVNIKALVNDEVHGDNYKLFAKGDMTDLSFETIDGSIEGIHFDLIGVSDIDFGIDNLTGDFKIVSPIIDIKYLNTFGFEARGTIDSLYLKDVNNDETSLLRDWQPMTMLLEPTDDNYKSLTNSAEYFIDNIDILNRYKKISFNGNIDMSCDNVKGYMISKDSHIDVVTDIKIPMNITMNQLHYLDTIDFDLSLHDDESNIFDVDNAFDELEFKFIFENKLPIEIQPQLYMLVGDNVIDTLITDYTCINACFDNQPHESVIKIVVNGERIDRVVTADKLLIDLHFSTNGNVTVMNVNDYIKIRLGLKTKTTELPF